MPPVAATSSQAVCSTSPSWLQGLPSPVKAFVGVVGIETDSDLSEYFADLAEIAEAAAQRQWPDDARDALVLAWREARHRAKRARAGLQVLMGSLPPARLAPRPPVQAEPLVPQARHASSLGADK